MKIKVSIEYDVNSFFCPSCGVEREIANTVFIPELVEKSDGWGNWEEDFSGKYKFHCPNCGDTCKTDRVKCVAPRGGQWVMIEDLS